MRNFLGAVFIGTALFIFGQNHAQKMLIDRVVAVIGNKSILQSDLESQYMQYKLQGVTSRRGNIKCEILEDMLMQKLMINQAAVDSIEIDEGRVETNLAQRLEYFIQQFGSQEEMEKYYNKKMYEIKDDLREMVKEQMLSQKMQDEIAGEIKITPSEVKSYYRNLPKDSLPLVNTEYELQQILIYPPNNSEAEIKVREKLLALRERITKGESFSTLAVLYSEDPGSARKGGELGFRNKSAYLPEFAEAAWSLNKNAVSKIVKTDAGFHIIQLIDRKEDRVNVRHILLRPKVATKDLLFAKQKLDSIANLIKKDSIAFEKAAVIYSEDKDSKLSGGLMVNMRTGNTKYEVDHITAEVYYSIKDLKVGEFSAPFKGIDKNGKEVYKLVKIKSKTAPHEISLKHDYNRVQKLALQSKKMEIVKKWVKEKVEKTYIKIIPDYRDCIFKSANWIK